MSLFDEEKPDKSVAQVEFPKESGRSPMIMLPILAAIAIIVAILLFFGGRWAYRSISNDSPPAPTVTEPAPEQKPSTSTTTPAPTSPPTTVVPTPSPSASGQNLPNSGPGEVLALFLTVSSVAALTYYLANFRRQN